MKLGILEIAVLIIALMQKETNQNKRPPQPLQFPSTLFKELLVSFLEGLFGYCFVVFWFF